MGRQIEDELLKFQKGITELRNVMDIEEVCKYAYTLSPKKKKLAVSHGKRLAFTVSGIVHGNETVGLAILNEFLHLLNSETIDCRIPIGVFLGNVPAAQANTRFLERDLNRCFDREGTTAEERRAKELSVILSETLWYFDIHQTNRPAEEPFFYFSLCKRIDVFCTKHIGLHNYSHTHQLRLFPRWAMHG